MIGKRSWFKHVILDLWGGGGGGGGGVVAIGRADLGNGPSPALLASLR